VQGPPICLRGSAVHIATMVRRILLGVGLPTLCRMLAASLKPEQLIHLVPRDQPNTLWMALMLWRNMVMMTLWPPCVEGCILLHCPCNMRVLQSFTLVGQRLYPEEDSQSSGGRWQS
jgi:hypothetical protein